MLRNLGVVLILSLWLAPVFGSTERVVTSRFADVSTRAKALGHELGIANVLLVYDIDNTLLAMDQELGSDQWYNWQDGLLKGGASSFRVATDVPGLLGVQGILFDLSHMHAPETDEPDHVAELQHEGFPSLLLSARGPEFRDATQRELSRNHYDFTHSGIAPQAGFAGVYLPYSPKGEGDLSTEEITSLQLGAPRTVSYENGLYMVSGQHKGAMLIALLHKTSRSYKAIVFVDDQAIHCDRMEKAFQGRDTRLLTYRYAHEDAKVAAFAKEDKQAVNRSWQALKTAVVRAFPSGVATSARAVAAGKH